MAIFFDRLVLSTSMTRSGAKAVLAGMVELDICAYWDVIDQFYEERDERLFLKEPFGEWLNTFVPRFEEEKDTGFVFAERISVQLGHTLKPPGAFWKILRPYRDVRDATISNFEREKGWQTSTGKDQAWNMELFLDFPLQSGQGGLFQLGQVEEWFLQEALYSTVLNDIPVHFIRYSDFMEDRFSELSKILDFLEVKRSDSQIQRAVDRTTLKNLTPKYGSPNKGIVGRWQEGQYPELVKRVNLLHGTMGSAHYLAGTSPETYIPIDWPHEIFTIALQRWAQTKLMGLSSRYFLTNFESFSEAISKIAANVKSIPLLEFYFCCNLLEVEGHAEFAVLKLRVLAENSTPFVRLVAARVLHAIFPKDRILADLLSETATRLICSPLLERHCRVALEELGFDPETFFVFSKHYTAIQQQKIEQSAP